MVGWRLRFAKHDRVCARCYDRHSTDFDCRSRAGGTIAAAWATLVTLGRDGYLEKADEMFKTMSDVVAGIQVGVAIYFAAAAAQSVIGYSGIARVGSA